MFRGNNIYLTSIEISDLTHIHNHYNDYDCSASSVLDIIRPYSSFEVEKNISISRNPETAFSFAIKETENNNFIGVCGHRNFCPKNRFCDIGISLLSAYQGKGHGTEATNLLVNFLFSELNIRKICLGVLDFNHNAISLYKKLGFEIEGVLHKHIYRFSKYHDLILMAKFNERE